MRRGNECLRLAQMSSAAGSAASFRTRALIYRHMRHTIIALYVTYFPTHVAQTITHFLALNKCPLCGIILQNSAELVDFAQYPLLFQSLNQIRMDSFLRCAKIKS